MTGSRHFRKSARPQIACKVTIHKNDWSSSGPIVSFTRDVGSGGLFAITDERFEMGEKVEVVLSTPSTWEPLVLPAEVCRIEDSEGEETGGVGVRFVSLTDTQLVALVDFTESLDFDG